MKLNQKLALFVLLFAVIVSGLTSLIFYNVAANQVTYDIRQRLGDIVSIAAKTIDAVDLERLADPTLNGSKEFRDFRAKLQEIRDASTDIRYIYTLRADENGAIHFVVDAESNPDDSIPMGEIYRDPSPFLVDRFATLERTEVETEFYTDEWGTWLSGYAPVLLPDGRRTAVLGVDIPASTVLDYKHRLLWISAAIFLFILPVTLVIGFIIGRRISRPIIAMKEGAERMGQGDLDHRIDIHRGDEIGSLANSLNDMAAKLKLGRERLSELMQKYRNIFDNAMEGIFQTTPDGRMITANRAMAEMLGYDSVDSALAEIGDLKNQVYARPEDRDQFLRLLDAEGRVTDMRALFKRRDGSDVQVEISGRVISDKGHGRIIEGMVRDISERLEKERADKERQAAEAASQAKSEFLANMSHEIRTPLNAVMGMTDLALRTELTQKQAEYLKKIKISSKALLAVINDILDFSKIEAGRLELEEADFSLYEVMANLSEMFSYRANEKDIEFAVVIGKDVPVSLVGDSVRLGQVLINLTGNAIKFTDKGEVVVRVEMEPGDSGDAPGGEESVCIRFSVEDSGIGIAPDRARTIFDSFTQADASTTRKYGGTGLGLAICKQLVELMGGEIGVASTPGEGSLFSFTAAFRRQPPEKQIKPRTPMDLKGLRVLVVDDNRTALDILAEIIASFNMHADTATSGEQAVELMQKAAEPYDLVLMDWKMPGLSGIETAKHIKRDLDLDKTPIICMVSAYGREDLIQQAERSFLDAFLHKPVNQSLLFDTIMGLFGRKSHMIAAPDQGVQHKTPDAAEHLAGARILLVEDNEINREVATEWLSSAGIAVESANNGRLALQALERGEYDAVLMDVQMPEMDGFEATGRIREMEKFDGLPIIAMTAHALKGDREKCIEAGMNDYVTKPIDPEVLFSTLAKWIDPQAKRPAAAPKAVPAEPRIETGEPELDFELPGISMETGLFRSNNNKKLYLKLLRSFSETYADSLEQAQKAMDEERIEEAVRLVHSVKGVAGNLGATELSEAAGALESALGEGERDILAPLWVDYGRKLSIVLAGLANNLPGKDAGRAAMQAEAPAMEAAELLARLKSLMIQLDEDLDAAAKALDEIRGPLAARAGNGSVEALASHLDDFDIDGAIDAVGEIVKTMEGTEGQNGS